MKRLELKTVKREQMLAVSHLLRGMIQESNWQSGTLLVHCPHTTAAVTINESADPDVQTDICSFMSRMVPENAGFRHAEGNSDAHIKSSLFGPQCFLIVENSQLCLGAWQEIYFCEWDGPRNRELWVQFLPAPC